MIFGIVSGYWGYRGLGRFVERHRHQLIEALKIPQARVPSYSTLRRVMMQVDYQALTQVFNDWASKFTYNSPGQWIAIDGKSQKNTVNDCYGKQQNFVMMVSAFTHERGEILGIEVMENKKQSEIIAVQDLIQLLDLSGVVFTMDALHCQKKSSLAIAKGGNDYLIVVKRNQKILHRQIEFQTLNKAPIRRLSQTEKTRNRLTHRTVEVFEPPLNLNSGWIGVKSFLKIFRWGIRNNHDYELDYPTYYISSLPPTSSLIPQGIRRHWNIENLCIGSKMS